MTPLNFGGFEIHRLVETEGLGFYPGFLLPDASEDALEGEREWLTPHFHDPDTGRFIQSVQGFLIKTSRHNVLVDSCVGNDKERPSSKAWHRQNVDWLGRLAACGVHPEEVDYVLCTHLHVDHVGWNTRLDNGRWVPTFPNARYLFHELEYAYWEQTREMPGEIGYGRTEGSFEDSVLPVMEARLGQLINDDFDIETGLWAERTPGHSPGHVCLHLNAQGETANSDAIFTGDLLHHPIQAAYPEWNSRYCLDAALSRKTREQFVDRYCDTPAVLLAAHFATPTAGRITRGPRRKRFTVL